MATALGSGDDTIMKNNCSDNFLQLPGMVEEHSISHGCLKITGQEGSTSQKQAVRRAGVYFQFFPGLVVQCSD
jgi:hypothetical protein